MKKVISLLMLLVFLTIPFSAVAYQPHVYLPIHATVIDDRAWHPSYTTIKGYPHYVYVYEKHGNRYKEIDKIKLNGIVTPGSHPDSGVFFVGFKVIKCNPSSIIYVGYNPPDPYGYACEMVSSGIVVKAHVTVHHWSYS